MAHELNLAKLRLAVRISCIHKGGILGGTLLQEKSKKVVVYGWYGTIFPPNKGRFRALYLKFSLKIFSALNYS